MKKINILTPENVEIEYQIGSVGSRGIAYMIDFSVQLLLMMGIILAVAYSCDEASIEEGWIGAILILVLYIIRYTYFIIMEYKMDGQSIGKKIMHIRTIRNNGMALTLRHIVIRSLFKVGFLTCGLEMIAMIVNAEGKRIGDYVGATLVVIESSAEKPFILQPTENFSKTQLTQFIQHLNSRELDLLKLYLGRKESLLEDAPIHQEIEGYFDEKFREKEQTLYSQFKENYFN